MKPYRIETLTDAELDVEAAFEWYESEQVNLGFEFLDELRFCYLQILNNPKKYSELRPGIRHSLLRRFPYSVYFSIEGQLILILAVLHAARDPAAWQERIE